VKHYPLILTLLGALPFVLVSVAVSQHMFTDVHFIIQMLLSYAAIIVAFLSGVHWGVALTQYNTNPGLSRMLIAGGVWPALVAWGILFYRDMHIQLLFFTILYSIMWAIDSILYNKNLLPQWFFELRGVLTPIVIVSLYVAYFGIITP
jgi:hypothetical protein